MKIKYTAKNFEIPAEGVHSGELVEIKDLGVMETLDGDKERVQFIFGLDETDSRGRDLLVFGRPCNKTLHPQSRLSKTIYDLTGEYPVEDEEYELDDLVGLRCQLVVKHNRSEKNGKVYANIAAILRPQTAREEARRSG